MEENTPNPKPSEPVIRFACEYCGKQIHVPSIHAGKKGKCPQCKKLILIPLLTSSPVIPQQDDEPIRLKRDCDIPAQTDRPVFQASEQSHRLGPEPDQNVPAKFVPPPEYKPATLVDVFAYPFSISGIIHFIIFWFGPFLLIFLERTFAYACCYFQLLVLGMYITLIGYFYYYFSSCIVSAAKDERRAPDLSFEDIPSAGDLIRRLLLFISASLICFLPAVIYIITTSYARITGRLIAEESPPILYIWCSVGVFFYPMFLLAVAMFDSLTAFNPIMILGSILSGFLPYCGLALLFFVIGLLMNFVGSFQFGGLSLLAWGLDVYLVFIAAYVLGRFFLRYEDRLNWEVKL